MIKRSFNWGIQTSIMALLMLFSSVQQIKADVPLFESGPTRVSSARNTFKGGLSLSAKTWLFSKQDIFTGPNNLQSGVTIWDSQSLLALNWGLLDHLDLTFAPVLVQSTHESHGATQFPGDLLLHAKIGSLGAFESKTKYALQFDARFPFAAKHDIPLQPYTNDAIGYGGAFLVSYTSKLEAPTLGLQWDLNIGYFNFNDSQQLLNPTLEDTTVQPSSTQLYFGTALRWHGQKFGLFTEVYGAAFLQQPPDYIFSRENRLYVTPGFRYLFNKYIDITAALDYLLLGSEDETVYGSYGGLLREKPWETLANYPDWRFNFAVTLHLRQGTPPVKKEKKRKEKATSSQVRGANMDESQKMNLDPGELEALLKEKQKAKKIDAELERQEKLRRERERMQQLLKQLREELKQRALEEQKRREEEEKRKAEKAAKKQAEQDSLALPNTNADSLNQNPQLDEMNSIEQEGDENSKDDKSGAIEQTGDKSSASGEPSESPQGAPEFKEETRGDVEASESAAPQESENGAAMQETATEQSESQPADEQSKPQPSGDQALPEADSP